MSKAKVAFFEYLQMFFCDEHSFFKKFKKMRFFVEILKAFAVILLTEIEEMGMIVFKSANFTLIYWQ